MKKNLLIALLFICKAATSQISTTGWVHKGPTTFPVNASGQINGIGRISQLKFHPTDSMKMYAASASGGLYYSIDRGNTWNLYAGSTQIPKTSLASICIDSSNNNTIYMGSGDANYYSNGYGVYKSIDNGATFTAANSGMGNTGVFEILQMPRNAATLIAVTKDGIFKTTNSASSWVRKTRSGLQMYDLCMKPKSNGRVWYACSRDTFYRSTDYGETWKAITSGFVFWPGGAANGQGMRVATSPKDTNAVIVGMVANYGSFFKSFDGGTSFVVYKNNASPNLVGYNNTAGDGGQGNYNYDIEMSPTDTNIVFMVGHNVWKSTNGGRAWTQMTNWYAYVHTDMHHIVYSPLCYKRLYDGNDGGVWMSTNEAGTSLASASTAWAVKSDGLACNEISPAASSNIDANYVSIGTQDNGELYRDASGWKTNRGGDWYKLMWYDFANSKTVYYASGKRRVVTSSESYIGPATVWNDFTVFKFNPNYINLCFAARNDTVWISKNILSATPTWNFLYKTGGNQITDVESSLADTNKLYICTKNAKLYYSSNALSSTSTFAQYSLPFSTWTTISWLSSVNNNSSVVYLFTYYKAYRSTNNGSSFTDISTGIPTSPNIVSISYDRFTNNESIFITNTQGVYYHNSSMSSWQNISQNLPTGCSAQTFCPFNNGCTSSSKLRLAFYGRGLWETDYNTTRLPSTAFKGDTLTFCPGITVHFTDTSCNNATSWSWTFAGGTPATSTLQNPTVVYNTAGNYNVTLTATNSVGSLSLTKPSYINVVSDAIPVTEDFETASLKTNWSLYDDGSNGVLWNRKTAVSGFGIGSACYWFDNYNNDARGKKDAINTSKYDLYAYDSTWIAFDRAYAVYSSAYKDSLEVRIASNCLNNFTTVYKKGQTQLATAPNNSSSIFTPTSTQWKRDTINVSAYAKLHGVQFQFRNIAGYGQPIYLDNIKIWGKIIPPTAYAGRDTTICSSKSISIGKASETDVTYSWTPTIGLSSSIVSNPIATPTTTTTYILTATHSRNLIVKKDTVIINVTAQPTWYRDFDADGFGNPSISQNACTQPTGYVSNNNDCNDNNAAMHLQYSFYVDADADGYGIGSLVMVCATNSSTPPTGYSLSNLDCDDNNAAIHSPILYYTDVDGDGFGSTNSNFICSLTAPTGYASNNTDCNDNNISMHQKYSFYIDNDGDGFGSTTAAIVCAINSTTAPTGYSINALDCNDNNSTLTTGNTFYVDNDGDGFGSATTAILCSTTPTTGYSSNSIDCDDSNAAIHIGNTFYIDNDGDGFGSTTSVILCHTSAPIGYSINNTDCNDNDATHHLSNLIPSISITVLPSNIVTQGTSVIFTATSSNSGTSPIYQWQKNNNVVGTNSNTYSTTPVNADSIFCILNSNAQCLSQSNATSNKIKMVVTPSSPISISNDNPCGAFNASANSGSIAGLPTVLSAYDDGSSVYGGLSNSLVLNSPPNGPSLVYYTSNNNSATSINDPIPSCVSYTSGYVPKTVWYKFRVPTFAAGVTLRSVNSYGQSFNAVLAVYKITSGTACSLPVFNEIQCSSTGILALTPADLISYQGQYLYVQLQGTTANPSGIFTLSIQGIVPNISLSAPTSTTITVNFPSISSPNIKFYVYWQRIGASGASYVGINPISSYTIGGLISGQNYKVWVKFVDAATPNGSAIYCEAKTLGTTSGCGGVLPAPTITSVPSHCARVYFNFTNPPISVPSPLIPPPSTFPIRLIWALNGTNRGWVQALANIPAGGYLVNNLILNNNYSFYYSYKCVGGAVMNSSITNYSACSGPARLNTRHHEYLINGVHFIDPDLEDLMAATMPQNIDDGNIHEITFDEIEYKNDELKSTSTDKSFNISPIPADKEIELKFNSIIKNGWIKIVDLSGKTVFTKEITENNFEQKINLSVSQLESGIYLIQLISENNFESQKIIISR
ncbi:MAG: hypothetical protein RJA07_2722 [Bacteroidota bacterium]|jgi:PKD repeat protein